MIESKKVHPGVRIGILFLSTVIIIFLSKILTGSYFPNEPFENLIFQGALLIVVFGSTVQEFHYTRPSESMINAFMAIITLLPVYKTASKPLWFIFFGYSFIIFILGVIVTGLSLGKETSFQSKNIVNKIYQPVVNFGRARILFSIIFLYSLFEFYTIQSNEFLVLLLFWGLFVVIWPLGIPAWISGLLGKRLKPDPIGKILRTDWPNVIHVELTKTVDWSLSNPKVFIEANGSKCLLVPINEQFHSDNRVGTGLYVPLEIDLPGNHENGQIYELRPAYKLTKEEIIVKLGGSNSSSIIGFVSQNSTISQLRFELIKNAYCEAGMLVWCKVGERKVFYQVTNGLTEEEAFQSNKFGYQTGVALQLGEINERGFDTFTWLPSINTPVFSEDSEFGTGISLVDEEDFIFGTIPGTKLEIGGSFIDAIEYHTAILGVTGTGKTELAIDFIKHSSERLKVICIDPTSKYEIALKDENHIQLSLGDSVIEQIQQRIYTADTADYGGKKQWGEVRKFIRKQQAKVKEELKEFLDSDINLALLNLNDISNANATLYLTDLYLSSLMEIAKEKEKPDQKVLIVLEEAHSTIPEPFGMGTQNDSYKGLVNKISQVALQGRKYSIGLLLIAQRTAHVSKSVLSQCNTIICFRCFDETSLRFLENIFGKSSLDLLPSLPFLSAIVSGKALRSENPLIISIPYSEEKKDHHF